MRVRYKIQIILRLELVRTFKHGKYVNANYTAGTELGTSRRLTAEAATPVIKEVSQFLEYISFFLDSRTELGFNDYLTTRFVSNYIEELPITLGKIYRLIEKDLPPPLRERIDAIKAKQRPTRNLDEFHQMEMEIDRFDPIESENIVSAVEPMPVFDSLSASAPAVLLPDQPPVVTAQRPTTSATMATATAATMTELGSTSTTDSDSPLSSTDGYVPQRKERKKMVINLAQIQHGVANSVAQNIAITTAPAPKVLIGKRKQAEGGNEDDNSRLVKYAKVMASDRPLAKTR